MMHYPTFDEFKTLAGRGTVVPVYRRLLSDSITPVVAFDRVADSPHSFLLESVVGGEKIGRYSFIGSHPRTIIRARGKTVEIEKDNLTQKFEADDPLAELEKVIAGLKGAAHPHLPRFTGGLVGYAAYDIVRYLEDLPDAPTDDLDLPDLLFALYETMTVFDHVSKTILVINNAVLDGRDMQLIYEEACRKVDAMVRILQTPADHAIPADIDPRGESDKPFTSNMTQGQYETAVVAAKEYIAAGDIFQVVISQRLSVETTASPLDIYRALRVVNPSPFMFFLKSPEVTLIGSSPEVLVRVEDGVVTNRPLAGTRHRGKTPEEDEKIAAELLADPKDRAEHIMLVDLGRNDVGRVAEPGTIELTDVMEIEKYSHVMHICSNVSGKLEEGMTAFDALRMTLPVGTVSGAPKVRAMQIIDEFETTKRGPYAGAVGYIDFAGNMDTCIALRTIVMTGDKAHVQVGAGLVADSDPASEYQETLNKGKALLKAIEVAERGFGGGRVES